MERLGALGAASLQGRADDGEVCLVVLLVSASLRHDRLVERLDVLLDGRQLLLEQIRERRDLRHWVVTDDGLLAHELLQVAQEQLLLPQLVRDLLRPSGIVRQRAVGLRSARASVEEHRDLHEVARAVHDVALAQLG